MMYTVLLLFVTVIAAAAAVALFISLVSFYDYMNIKFFVALFVTSSFLHSK